jgi:ankyrin repeat protein
MATTTQEDVDAHFWDVVCKANDVSTNPFGAIYPSQLRTLLQKRYIGANGETLRANVDTVQGGKRYWHRYTALTWAILQGHLALVRALVEGGANPNRLGDNENDRTPLKSALYTHRNRYEMLKLLLDLGADTSVLLVDGGWDGPSCLHWVTCINRGDVTEKLGLLLSRIPTDKLPLIINSAGNRLSRTPLMAAISEFPNARKTVAMLVQAGADINLACRDTTPLACCVRKGVYTYAILKDLLLNGANTEAVVRDMTRHGNWGTVLHLAVYMDRYEAVEILLGAGANAHAADSDGQTPYMMSAKYPQTRRIFDHFEAIKRNEAFAMGQHPRLGGASYARGLYPELVRMVIERLKEDMEEKE